MKNQDSVSSLISELSLNWVLALSSFLWPCRLSTLGPSDISLASIHIINVVFLKQWMCRLVYSVIYLYLVCNNVVAIKHPSRSLAIVMQCIATVPLSCLLQQGLYIWWRSCIQHFWGFAEMQTLRPQGSVSRLKAHSQWTKKIWNEFQLRWTWWQSCLKNSGSGHLLWRVMEVPESKG